MDDVTGQRRGSGLGQAYRSHLLTFPLWHHPLGYPVPYTGPRDATAEGFHPPPSSPPPSSQATQAQAAIDADAARRSAAARTRWLRLLPKV